MSNEPKAGTGLDPELLAAYIDKRLSPEQRAVVEAQLASDPDSYAVLVETMKALDADVPEARTVRMVTRASAPKVRWVIVGGVLAAAAALALVVWTQPDLIRRLRRDDASVQLERLVAAVGEERYVEARLTGGFRFGPLRSVNRGSGSTSRTNLSLVAAAGELQKRAQANPTPVNLHNWGVAQLLLLELDGAIDALQAATLADPRYSAALADLSAAYLTRFQIEGNAQDLPRALEAAERARQLPSPPVEVLFTRALTLELMNLNEMAASTWHDYLASDADSPWADEARRKLNRLESMSPRSRWDQLQRDLLEPSSQPSVVVASIVREFPEEIPDLLFGDVLRRWSVARRTGETTKAEGLLARAQLLARGAADNGGDASLLELTMRLADRRSLEPRTLETLGSGVQELDADQYRKAEPLLKTAHSELRNDSVLSPWSAFYLARVSLFLGRQDDALKLLAQAGAGSVKVDHPQLAARASWLRGIIRFTQGQYGEARKDYEHALTLYRRAGEPRAGALALMNLSVIYRFWGDRDRSWQFRLQGLVAMPRHRPNRYYGFLTSTAVSASLDELPRTAIAVMDEAVAAANSLPANIRAESLLQRARLRARAGSREAALTDLESARQSLEAIADATGKTRITASLNMAIAEVLQDIDPSRAVKMATEAAAAFEAQGDSLRSAELALYTARSLANLRDEEGSLSALEAGIATFNVARAEIPSDDPARISAVEPAWQLFDENFSRRVIGEQFDRADAFAAFEASRARTVIEARGNTAMAWEQVQRSLAESRIALVLLHQRENELIVWQITAGVDRLFRLPWDRDESVRLVALCKRELIHGRGSSAGRVVHDAVLEPLSGVLVDGGTVIVVPDGPFHQMPWAGLPGSTGEPVVRRWAFSVAPSVTLALRPTSVANRTTALIVGADKVLGMGRLPAVIAESKTIASLYPHSILLLAESATPGAVLSNIAGAGVVHIAAHAIDSPTYPLLSRLLLAGAEDSGLTVSQIVTRADAAGAVVVLAACSSIGRGQRRGEGTVGLAWAFLMANASTVVGSLWDLDDVNTSAVFTELHANFTRGLRPSEALRSAQLSAIDRGVPASDWAAIQVVGQP